MEKLGDNNCTVINVCDKMDKLGKLRFWLGCMDFKDLRRKLNLDANISLGYD